MLLQDNGNNIFKIQVNSIQEKLKHDYSIESDFQGAWVGGGAANILDSSSLCFHTMYYGGEGIKPVCIGWFEDSSQNHLSATEMHRVNLD